MPPAPFRLSVLDQSPISEGSSGAQALRNTIDLARLADRLGYHRYWVAEHHGGPMLAGPSPEALIGPIAAATSRIRVGSGGVMLPHYSPLKVAETFSLLAGLFPGRIDLALGRAAGTDPLTTFALQRDRRQGSPDDFPQQLSELLGYLDDRLPEDHSFARLAKTLPGRPERPEPWLLGSSQQSAIWAAELGCPYAFADFINPKGAEITVLYRERFAEHEHAGLKPRIAVAVLGDLRGDRRGGRTARRQWTDDVHAAAPWRIDRGSTARRRQSSSSRPMTARGSRGLSGGPSLERPTRSGWSSRTWSRNTGPRRRSS